MISSTLTTRSAERFFRLKLTNIRRKLRPLKKTKSNKKIRVSRFNVKYMTLGCFYIVIFIKFV